MYPILNLMRATEDRKSLFSEIRAHLLEKYKPKSKKSEFIKIPKCYSLSEKALKELDKGPQVKNKFGECSFDEQNLKNYTRQAAKLLKKYNQTVDSLLKKEAKIIIPNIDGYCEKFSYTEVTPTHIQDILKNCSFLNAEQQKEVYNLLIQGYDDHCVMLKLFSDCVAKEYREEVVFLYCVFCEIQKIMSEHVEEQELADQRMKGKNAALKLSGLLQVHLKKIVFKVKPALETTMKNAFQAFLRDFCNLVMRMIHGVYSEEDEQLE